MLKETSSLLPCCVSCLQKQMQFDFLASFSLFFNTAHIIKKMQQERPTGCIVYQPKKQNVQVQEKRKTACHIYTCEKFVIHNNTSRFLQSYQGTER